MYKKIVFGLAGLLMLFSTPSAFADRGDMYFGVGAANWTFQQKVAPTGTGSATGIRGVFGQQFSDILGWEVQLETGGSVFIPGGIGTIQLNALAGGYLRANLPLGSTGDLHALVGFGSASFSNSSTTAFNSSMSYGFGGQVKVGKKMALRADYMQNVSNSNWDVKSVTFGANFYF